MDDFEKIKRLLFRYNRELTREKGLFLTKKQLSRLDTVDFSDFIRWETDPAQIGTDSFVSPEIRYIIREWNDDEVAACKRLFDESGAFATVPCYSEAVIDLGGQWIHQRVERLDLDSMEMDIYFQQYQRVRGFWEPDPPVTFRVYLNNSFAHLKTLINRNGLDWKNEGGGSGSGSGQARDDLPDFEFINGATYFDMYKLLPEFPESLTAEEREVWERILKRRKDDERNEIKSRAKSPQVFTHINLRINAYLAAKSRTHKHARAQTDTDAKDAKVDAKDTQVAKDVERQSGDNVRRVSLQVRFSGKRPAVPTSKSVRKWKTAQWKVRGHMRHYKDGRKVWIKERVCHRKDMNEAKIGPQSRRNVLILEGGGRA